MKYCKFPDGTHKEWGSFDSGQRWYPADELTEAVSFNVRSPSRAYPYSYLKHFYSIKFAKLLASTHPALYCKVLGISRRTKRYKEIIAAAVLTRITKEAR